MHAYYLGYSPDDLALFRVDYSFTLCTTFVWNFIRDSNFDLAEVGIELNHLIFLNI